MRSLPIGNFSLKIVILNWTFVAEKTNTKPT